MIIVTVAKFFQFLFLPSLGSVTDVEGGADRGPSPPLGISYVYVYMYFLVGKCKIVNLVLFVVIMKMIKMIASVKLYKTSYVFVVIMIMVKIIII